MSSNLGRGFPQNNVRYRRNSKSPDTKNKYKKDNDNKKLSVLEEMQQMKRKREERIKRIEDEKQHKKDLLNDPNYIPKLDYDFEYLIRQKKLQIENIEPQPHSTSENSKIYVCVRKRPIFEKEIQNGEIDCLSAINPKIYIYDCKLKIDGYTKYIDVNDFYFDNVFNENDDTNLLFECSVKPSLDILLKGGVVTCFAYGQTGSGKTYTMKGIQDYAIDNIFEDFNELKKHIKKNFKFFISFFEIYSGRLYDLLNNRNKVSALEDKNQKVQIYGLTEKEVFCPKDMHEIIDYANAMRTTHNTVTNETSSRSHAICNFTIKICGKKEDEEFAKLTLVDLAGSERATETQSNNKSRLAEGAEINKSLLALKECIRALDVRKIKGNNDQHVPFRNSKLTLVLRDSFLYKANLCKIIMISCVSPSNHSSNHTINTLRYSDRLKEKTASFSLKKHVDENVFKNNDNNFKNIDNNNFNLLDKNKNKKVIKSPIGQQSAKQNFNVSKNLQFQKKNIDKKEREISEGKFKDNFDKKINNFFDDVEDLDEDDMQKLELKPTPINDPPRKKTFAPKKKNKYALQKKTKTERLENNENINNNNINNNNEVNDNLNKINEEELMEPKQEIMNINKEKEEMQNSLPYIIEEQEALIGNHMDIIKSEAKLLTEEGNLISKIKGITEENYSMEEYVPKIEEIIMMKLNYFKELKQKIKEYKSLLG